MEKLIRAKFEQNDKFKRLLKDSEYTHYYEMTADKKWASGTKITHATKTVDASELTGKNVVGNIIAQIKKELLETEGPSLTPEREEEPGLEPIFEKALVPGDPENGTEVEVSSSNHE